MAVRNVVDVLEAYRGDIIACLGTVAVVVLIVFVKRRVVGDRVVEPLRTLEPAQMALVLGDDDGRCSARSRRCGWMAPSPWPTTEPLRRLGPMPRCPPDWIPAPDAC